MKSKFVTFFVISSLILIIADGICFAYIEPKILFVPSIIIIFLALISSIIVNRVTKASFLKVLFFYLVCGLLVFFFIKINQINLISFVTHHK
jgi:hypothetical protein